MLRKFIRLTCVALLLGGLIALTQTTRAQAQNPTPAPLGRPDINYSESNGCTGCHFSRGAGGDHNTFIYAGILLGYFVLSPS